MKLTSENVRKLTAKCLFKPEDLAEDGMLTSEAQLRLKKVNGVSICFGFDTSALNSNRNDIEEMLGELPDAFKTSGGGGMTFLNACMTKDGELWGQHRDIDDLICLGLAIDKVAFTMPKEMWNIFPGGMPYITVKL